MPTVCRLSSTRHNADCQNLHKLPLLFSPFTSLGNSRKILVLLCRSAAERFQQVGILGVRAGRVDSPPHGASFPAPGPSPAVSPAEVAEGERQQ